ncbi:GDSL-type esterase/lipase family protein [Actinoallomurus soli]|uniref:GDSL-type esterase/lipase family protein n=1 Tax=Actinoallomurus soli TaxID=2952535 RepID=UPI002093B0F8|nr:GDSL-type esterase/lipase family protein [Actinoallomurus soli]MCO5968509.1 GDSL-type esterase/lipase family protein [Actinoallomurus soli]
MAAAATLTVAAAGAAGSASAAGRPAASPWFTSWAQSQQDLAAKTLADQSVRMITHVSQGGGALRIRVQNTFGKDPLTIDATTVGRSGNGAAITGATVPVTFQGRRRVTIPAGGEVWSDAAGLRTGPQDDVAVSMFVAGTAVPGEHVTGMRENYLTPAGAADHTADLSGDAYTQTVTSTYLVSAVDVRNPAVKGTIVPFGSSVVDGVGSDNCGPGCSQPGNNRRWTDDLARRITHELPSNRQLAVANAGISGTTSSAACPNIPAADVGLDALARLDRDVLALHGVTGVIYYYGTNDLADGCASAPILDSYRKVFERLRAAGIKVYVTPITPRPGYGDQNNRDRYTVGTFVKQWGNCAGTCDGVVDFDQVLKDPLKPNSINLAYDNGDGIHANMAGQQALADYISLPMLAASIPKRR